MSTNTGPNARVVVVGADTGIGIKRTLEGRGMTTERVRTIAACLESLATADCVVIEGSPPDVGPVDCCRAIREQWPAIPIVIVPEDGSEALAGAVVAAGADGYVPRSQVSDTLRSRLDAVLETQAATDRSLHAGREEAVIDTAPVTSVAEPSNRLTALVEQSPLAIVEWTPAEFDVRTWNPAATELFGYTAAEAIGESALELLVPAGERRAVREDIQSLVDDGLTDPSWRENCNVRKDGTTVTCEWFDIPLGEDGEIERVLSFGRNVTADRKRANALEALQETTQKLLRAESAEEIGDIVLTATEDVIDRSFAGIRLYDEESETLEATRITPTLEEYTDGIPSVGPGDTVFWEAYSNQEPTIAENVSMDRVPYDIGAEIGTALFQPLGDHGLFTVAASGDDTLDDTEIHLIHVLARTAEAALDRAARERELERTKTVVETVGDYVYQLDLDGRFVTINDTTMGEIDYDRDDLLGEYVSKLLTDESVERGQRHIQALIDGERRIATYEVTLTGPNGERTPGEVNMALLRSNGEIDGTVGIARDISDRKRMEQQLVDRKSKIEGLHDVASRLDDCQSREEIYEITVEAAEDVLNFDLCCVDRDQEGSLVKRTISSTLDADLEGELPVDVGIDGTSGRTRQPYRIDDVEADDNAVASVDGLRSVLSVPIGDHGVFQAISMEPGAFTSADAELAELLLSHVTDALDRIAFEERLRTERDRFAALFENIPDAVVSVSQLEDGPVVEAVNPAFERVFGYAEADLVGEPLDEIIVPPDRATAAQTLNRRGSRGEVGESEVKRRTANGLRDFRLRVVPMEMDGSSDRAFGLYTDITEQKQRQKRLEILNRVLRHDLRNGMNIIDGCAEMLATSVDDADREFVETIRCRTSELTALAQKTRAVERVLDREEVPSGPIDLVTAVERAVARLERTADIEITCSLPERAVARGDEYLEAAVFQILENAVEHNDRPQPSIDVTLCTRSTDGLLSLSIADDGPGIPTEERDLLEGNQEITPLRHASGLGLWLVNWVVTQAGGHLSFTDNEPRGTVVTLEVPRADSASLRSTSGDTAVGDDRSRLEF
ncbi:PAS domain S-box protein [Natrinema ejinorense]|uniref:histidine kinase n=1 Tax=Natrinema ejinorense TaxID=373386 RepID=A0A2A5QT86_9EURY|nr:PAS domain S-box protein [Natrinema ejinorense]PCR89989.1 histidine kinase [Natrinema ejinorense]